MTLRIEPQPTNTFLKKVVILIVLLGIVAGVWATVFRSKGKAGPAGGASVVGTQAIGSASISHEPKGDPLLASLNDSNFFVTVVQPANFQPLVVWFQQASQRIKNTAAWKKLNLDTMVEGFMKSGGQENLDTALLLEQLRAVWGSTEALVLSVSANTFKVAGQEIPTLLLRARFDADASVETIRKALDQDVLKGAAERKEPNATIKRTEAGKYEFDLTGPAGSATGAVQLSAKNAAVLIGSKNLATWTEGGSKLIDQQSWKDAEKGFMTNAAMVAYVDVPRAFKPVEHLLGAALAGESQTAQASLQTLKEMSAIAVSWGVGDGLLGRQCVQFKPNAASFEVYQKNWTTPSDTVLRLAITPDTILAGRLSRGSLEQYVEVIRDGYARTAAGAQKADEAQWNKFLNQFDKLRSAVFALPFDEVAVTASTSATQMMPQFNVLMPTSKSYSASDLKRWAEGLAQALTEIGVAPLKPETKTSETGRELVTFAFDEKTSAVFGVANDKTVVAGVDATAIDSVASVLSGEPKVLTAQLLKSRQLDRSLPSSDSLYYLSTGPLIDMGKPFLPFLLMSQPDIKLSNEEVDELLNMLRFSVLSAQTSSVSENQMVCTDGRVLAY